MQKPTWYETMRVFKTVAARSAADAMRLRSQIDGVVFFLRSLKNFLASAGKKQMKTA